MQKPLIENLQNDIDNLINASTPFIHSAEELQILTVELLEETYNLINKLEEVRFQHNISKLQHDSINIQPYIDRYKRLQEKAIEQEDQDLASRYAFAHGMYELFQTNSSVAIGLLRLNMIAMEEVKKTPEFKDEYLIFLKEHNPDEYDKKRRHLLSLDLIVDIFNHLESYNMDKKTILKSASLRLFNFFNTVTYGQKTKLAKNIEYLFASLGEDVSLNPKRASKIRKIGSFQNVDLFDFEDNQKLVSNDIDIDQMMIDLLPQIAEKLIENGFDQKGNTLLAQKYFMSLQKSLGFMKP